MPVKAPTGVQQSRHAIHQPIDLIAGAVAAWMIVAHGVLSRSVAQFGDRVHDGFAPNSFGEPGFEGIHARPKLLGCAGPIHLPHLLVEVASLATTVTNFKKTVQEAQDHSDRRDSSLVQQAVDAVWQGCNREPRPGGDVRGGSSRNSVQ